MSAAQTVKSWLGARKANLKFIYASLNLFFTPSLIDTDQSQRFSGPGSAGFKGGVFNPGALAGDDNILIVAKGQHVHWDVAPPEDFAQGDPLLFSMNYKFDLLCTHKISVIDNLPGISSKQIEDFRLFRFNNKIYSNHTLLCLKKEGGYDKCLHTISALNTDNRTLTLIGQPLLDFNQNNQEKNWGFFEHKDELYLLYSFSPYILLKAMDWPALRFKTVVREETNLTFYKPPILQGEHIALSTNPISYDEKHFLVIIHSSTRVARYRRLYFHWAVLIDKKSLLPVKITSCPLLKGGKCNGMMPGVIFTMATLLIDDYLVLFSGEGDSFCSYVKIKQKILNASFVDFK